MSENKITYLLGDEIQKVKPTIVFSENVRGFLDDLSKALRGDVEAKQYPDVMTFAFWCRKANIEKLSTGYSTNGYRVGRGLVFHIAPSNVPINFAFSLVFGMLAGNANIVRASSKDFPQTRIVCRVMKKLFEDSRYALLGEQNAVVMYDRDPAINDMLSAKCDVRVIWGGDETIREIRKSPINSRTTEIAFADRYSFALFDEASMEVLSEEEREKLVLGFYNDTYLMDQNACSSPHMIIWKHSEERKGRTYFYEALSKVAARSYDLEDKKVIDKYTLLYEMAAKYPEIEASVQYENLLYVAKLSTLNGMLEQYRGKFGLFFEYELENIEEIGEYLSKKVQTCVAYGIDKSELVKILAEQHCMGVDRIVTPGQAMDIGIIWDGYDVIGNMSRIII